MTQEPNPNINIPHSGGVPSLNAYTFSPESSSKSLPQRAKNFKVLDDGEIFEVPKDIHFATFDFDGTLCVTEEQLHVMRYRHAANRALGWEISDQEWKDHLAGALGTGDRQSSEGILGGCVRLQTALVVRHFGIHKAQEIIGRTLSDLECSEYTQSAKTQGDSLSSNEIEKIYWDLTHSVQPKNILQFSIDAGVKIIQGGGFEARPGVVELLTGLKETGRPCNLNTGTCRQLAEPLLIALKLERYFQHIVTGAGRTLVRGIFANEIPREEAKPDGRNYNRAAHKLGAHPTEAIAFEDTISGTKAAARSGYKIIVVTPTPEVLHGDFDGFVLSLMESVRGLVKPSTQLIVTRSLDQIKVPHPPHPRPRNGVLP